MVLYHQCSNVALSSCLVRAVVFRAVFFQLLVSVAQHTSPTHSLILNIIQRMQELTMLAIHVRLLIRNTHDREDALRLSEDAVHFFQRPTGCLRIEEEYNRNDECVTVIGQYEGSDCRDCKKNLHNGENNVGLVVNVIESDRGDHNHEEVEDPVRRCR